MFSFNKPPGISLGELQDTTFARPQSILGPWLTQSSLTLLFAPTGIGKSFFSFYLAHAIAVGGTFLKWKAPKPRRVLLADGEMGLPALQDRLAQIEDSSELKAIGGSMQIMSLDSFKDTIMPNLADTKQQGEYTRAADGCSVIIIDNLLTCARATHDRDTDFAQWARIQRWALQMRSAGKAVIFVHHTGKDGGSQLGTVSRETVMNTTIRMSSAKALTFSEGLAARVEFLKHRHFFGEDAEPLHVEYGKNSAGIHEWRWMPMSEYQAIHARSLNTDGLSELEIGKVLGLEGWQVRRLMSRGGH